MDALAGDPYPTSKFPFPTEPRGKAVQMTCFVDSDHAGDQVSRRSRTGV